MTERDEASEFFFVNRARIQAWAGLRAQARDSMDIRLLALDGAVLGLARALGAGWRHGGLGGADAHRRLGLRRDNWPLDDAAGSVTIAIGWNWHQLLSVGASDEWPWVGVRLGVAEGAVGREPWAGLLSTTTQLQPRAGDDLRRADSWPLLRPVRDGGSTDELAAACLRELQSFWTEYSDAVDDWLAAGATSGPWRAA